MKHTVLLLAIVFTIPLAVSAKKKLTPVKVEVVEQNRFDELYGASGSILGRRSRVEGVSLKVIVNGDHALLRCYENHQGCNTLGPGIYDAEIMIPKCSNCSGRDTSGKGSDPDVWIYYIQPIDHKRFREHWRVSGTW